MSQVTTPTLPSPLKGEGLARLPLRGTSGQGEGEKGNFYTIKLV